MSGKELVAVIAFAAVTLALKGTLWAWVQVGVAMYAGGVEDFSTGWWWVLFAASGVREMVEKARQGGVESPGMEGGLEFAVWSWGGSCLATGIAMVAIYLGW